MTGVTLKANLMPLLGISVRQAGARRSMAVGPCAWAVAFLVLWRGH